MPNALRPVVRSALSAGRWLRYRLGLYESEGRLADEAQRYWTGQQKEVPPENYHWRGSSIFENDSNWLAIGRCHFELFERFARMTNMPRPLGRVIEWGCGGGANAVHFAREAREFVGVDLSAPALEECGRQVLAEGSSNFTPVHFSLGNEGSIVREYAASCDLFLCTYVFELLPTPEHGKQLLEAAFRLLRPGGMAFIQIKYETDAWWTRSRRWGYSRNVANMTTYRIDAFWTLAEACGFIPQTVTLRPVEPIVRDERYAYFCLDKPA